MTRHTQLRAMVLPIWVLSICWIGAAIGPLQTVLAQSALEAPYYRSEPLPMPKGLVIEVSGMTHYGDNRIVVCTRRGELYLVSNPWGPLKEITYSKFYEGLQEPLGLLQYKGWLYVAQRGELSRLRDEDGDGRADVLETVCDAWTISGNYHEYNFGPRIGPNGKLWITTNKPFGAEPFGRAHWRGFALSIDPESGAMTPVACGLRSPCGIGFGPGNDLFYTDNQGEWCGASKLSHIEAGDFHGHPHGIFSCKEDAWKFPIPPKPPKSTKMGDVKERIASFKMPAVWFPYDKMGKSPAGFVTDMSEGQFGPFAGQIFVTDQHHASVMRVDLEKVDGHWQGACFPFREGLQCGAIRALFSQDGKALMVGQTNRGWGSKGNKSFGLERITWTGRIPFEVQQLRLGGATAQPRSKDLVSFNLKLTQAVEPASTTDPAAFRVSSYTYLLHERYGSPEVDTLPVPVHSVSVAKDRLSVQLHFERSDLRKGYVHEFHLGALKSATGTPLLHSKAYYTLVKLPKTDQQGEANDAAPETPTQKHTDSKLDAASDQTAQLASGANKWITLFDGKTLNGWHNPYTWGKGEVVDGEIHLRGNRKWFLATKERWADFEFEAEVHVPVGGNSGIMFRCHVKPNRVFGYQAEVDTSDRKWSGGIYDEGRRAWVSPVKDPKAQAALKRGEWNRYRIKVVGDHIQTWVNDVPVTDFRDGLDLEGHFALQHHGEKGKLYRFKNIRVKPLGRHVWKSLIGSDRLGALRPEGKAAAWTQTAEEVRFDTSNMDPALLVSGGFFSGAIWSNLISQGTLRLRYRATGTEPFRLGLLGREGKLSEVFLHSGGILASRYSEDRRIGESIPVPPTKGFLKKHYKPAQWNTLHIHCADGNVFTKLNGHFSVAAPKSESLVGALKVSLSASEIGVKSTVLTISGLEMLTPQR